MVGKNRIIGYFFTFLVTILILLSYALSGNAQTLYSCVSTNSRLPFIHTIDPDTGATLTTTEITLQGEELRGCNGLAKDPTTGVCWIILSGPGAGGNSGSPGPRILATIDTDTGIATEIGDTGLPFAGIAFDTSETLYGLTGSQAGAALPTIYMLSKDDGSPTIFQALVDSDVGEALGFNPNDDLLYRMDGRAIATQVFESINPNNMVVTQIILSGPDEINETTALTHQSDNVLLAADDRADLYSLTTGGAVSFIGDMDHTSKGLAFDCGIAPLPPPAVPTLSEWGLIAMAAILGIVGFMVIRRRKMAA